MQIEVCEDMWNDFRLLTDLPIMPQRLRQHWQRKVIAAISTLSDLFSEDHKCLVEFHKVKWNLFVHSQIN